MNKNKIMIAIIAILIVVASCSTICYFACGCGESNTSSTVDEVAIATEDEITTTTITEPITTISTEPTTQPEVEITVEENDEEDSYEYDNSIEYGMFELTAYCNCYSCCGEWSGGPTATGVMPQAGRTIAVDPNVIPYGTKVLINGNVYVAEDCGGAIVGNRIDVYFGSHSEALDFGRQWAYIEILT